MNLNNTKNMIVKNMGKITTHKYFLYIMVVVACSYVLGAVIQGKLNTLFVFALTGTIAHYFIQNIGIVLFIALFISTLLGTQFMREGLENATTDKTIEDTVKTNDVIDSQIEKISSVDPQIASAVPLVKQSKNNDELKQIQNNPPTNSDKKPSPIIDVNNSSLNKTTETPTDPKGVGTSNNTNKRKQTEHFGPRLDYAATIEQSYENLDSLLGSDSIQRLTTDTQKLMQQQQNLFDTMNQMVPVLKGAQDMLKGFDMSSLTSSLKGITSLGSAPTPVH